MTGYNSFSLKKGYADLLGTEIAIEQHAHSIGNNMLQCRRNEKDFLLRMDTRYYDKLKKNIEKLTVEANTVKEISQTSGFEDVQAKAEEIVKLAGQYEKYIGNVVDRYIEIGLDHESGLQGEFRTTAQDLAERLERYQVGALYHNLLLIRRWEKDYLRVGSEKYETRLLAAISDYQNMLAESRCEEESKSIQARAINEYASQCEELIRLKRSGLAADDAYTAMRESAHNIENTLKSIMLPDGDRLLLEVRKHEKDYLLRRDDKYLARLSKTVGMIRKATKESELSAAHAEPIYAALDKYEAAFNLLVNKYADIDAAVADLRQSVHKIEAVIDPIVEESEELARVENVIDTGKFGKTAGYVGCSRCGRCCCWRFPEHCYCPGDNCSYQKRGCDSCSCSWR